MRFAALGRITIDGEAPSAPQLRRLLAELLVARNRPLPQDVLIEALWDGAPPPAAISAFQSKVSRLRRLLRPDELRSTPAGYVLHVDDDGFDVPVFEARAAAGRSPVEVVRSCTDALDLWRGPAFEVAAGDPLVEPEARRLELLRHRTMERRIDALVTLGDHDEVIAACLVLNAENPFAEPAWEARIRSLARIGRKVEALRVFDEYRRLLAQETGLVPSPRLAELERAVLDDRVDAASPTAPAAGGSPAGDDRISVRTPPRPWLGDVAASGPMVGRPALTTAVRGWVDGVRNGSSVSALVIGAAGAGKTSVLHELTRQARARAVPVRSLRSRAPDQPLFHPFSGREVEAGSSGAMLTTARSIAGHLVEEAGRVGGMVIAFDDLQLADAGTVEVAASLAELIGEGSEAPVALLVTSRPVAPGSELDRLYDRLAREPSHRHWVLHPLDEAGIHEVVRSRTGLDPTPVLTAAVAAESGGLPYTCLAHLRALRAAEQLTVTSSGRLHASAAAVAEIPADLRPTLGAVIGSLSPAALDVLAVTTLGTAAGADVRTICALDDEVFDAAGREVDHVLAAGFGDTAGLTAAHDLTREAIRACLPEAERRDVHRRIAEHHRAAIAVDPSAAAAFFEHSVRAGRTDDPDLVAAPPPAGPAAAESMRWAAAPACLDVVAERGGTLVDRFDAGVAGFRNHDALACRRHLSTAIVEARRVGDARVEANAAIVLQRSELNLSGSSSNFDEVSLIELGRRIASSEPALASQAWAMVAEARFHAGEHQAGLDLIDEAMRLGVDPDDHGALAAVTFASGVCLMGLVRLDDAQAAFDLARVHAEQADDAWKLAWCLGRLALVALHRGDGRAALRHCVQARAVERPTNNWAELALTETIAATAHAWLGEVDLAVDAAYDALALTKRSAYEWTSGPALAALLAGACARDDVDHAASVLADLAELAGERASARWAELAVLVVPALSSTIGPTGPGHERRPSARPERPGPDIRRLGSLGLSAETSSRRGEPLDAGVAGALAAVVAAGARCPLGWPFDLAHLAALNVQ